jgi:threonylcarbamoyladenosine tRNA methylthiotransferase MtaB
MKKAAFYTLGCKVNQVDTEQIKEAFLKQGYQVVDFNEAADIYVINTCTVTHVSDRKSRAVIRRAARRNPLAQIVVTGCLAQADPDQIKAIPGVSMVVDNQDKERIPDLVGGTVRGDADGVFASLTPVLFTSRHERTRAFIKIEDGCHSYCSYCIVPYTRGAVRSKRPEHVQAELQRLVELGYREIVLTGIHTGLYGYDLKNINLTELLKQLLGEVDGDYRIRLSSIEPLEICPALLQLVQQEPRICRHFHVPLQSGSDTVLKAMNRRYNGQYYRDLILEISKRIPGVGLSADVMVGFPGESRQDFQATYDLLAELPLLDLHVFKYSRREGTPAALMKGQIDEGVKQERSQALLQLARDKHFQRLENSCGQMLRVLVEQRIQAQTYTGLSDNYIEVRWDSSRDLRGEFAKVRIIGQEQGVAMGCVDDIPVH